jgi:hypothetical protein
VIVRVAGTVDERDALGADEPTVAPLAGAIGPTVMDEAPDREHGAALAEVLRDAAGEVAPGLDVDPQAWSAGAGQSERGDDAAARVAAGGVIGEGAEDRDAVHRAVRSDRGVGVAVALVMCESEGSIGSGFWAVATKIVDSSVGGAGWGWL